MKALVNCVSEKRLKLEERPVPSTLEPDEVLVRMVASGVCGTDLKVIEGKIGGTDGVIMGHESIGDVVEVGSAVKTGFEVGSRVVLQPNVVCHKCASCAKYEGINDIHCDHQLAYGIIIDGGMSEYGKFKQTCVKQVPEGFTSINAVLIEPIACLLHGFWRIESALTQLKVPKILVLGAGMIGLLWCRILQHEGYADLYCTDQSEDRMDVAAKLGTKTVSTSRLQTDEFDNQFDVIIDCTGYAPCLTMSMDKVAKGGTILIFGCCAEWAVAEVKPYQIYAKEVRIMGSVIYDTATEFDKAVEYVWSMERKGLLNVDDFLIGKFTYENIEEGWQKLMKKEIPKLILLQ